MTFRHTFKTAITGLRTNKTRSVLTILGIVIGITSIIMIMSLGQGAQDLILAQVQGMGTKTIIVLPGRQARGPSDGAQMFSDSLKEQDFDSLKKKSNAPNIVSVMPIVMGGETGFYQNQAYRLTIFGASEIIPQVFDLGIQDGDFFSADDVKSYADVVVLGSKVKKELFGDSNAIGERIKIKGRNLRVVGVMPEKGQVSFFNFDEVAIVPYSTAQQYIFGIKYYHRFIIQADSEQNIQKTVEDVTATLRNNHSIDDPDKDDFNIQTQADLASRLGIITTTFTYFLLGIAAISLVVGGIGIMNIMLVSVTERTREIGLRKAIGATEKNIMTQFLLEAVTLTGLGGAVGIGLGALLSFIITLILRYGAHLQWVYTFPVGAAAVGLFVSALIGLTFGLYPARKAAEKSPIEALRYE